VRRGPVVRFAPVQEPPVGAVWSLTTYDQQCFQVANPIDWFAIGDGDRLGRGADGSLEMLAQHGAPGSRRRSNWLPAPAGRFNITARLHGPLTPARDGRWVPPPVQRVW
jgi:hypothetical protein